MLTNLINSGFTIEHAEQLSWIKTRLTSAAEDREEDGNIFIGYIYKVTLDFCEHSHWLLTVMY